MNERRAFTLLQGHLIASFLNKPEGSLMRRQERDTALLLLSLYLICVTYVSPQFTRVPEELTRRVLVSLVETEGIGSEIEVENAVDVASSVAGQLGEARRKVVWECLLMDDEQTFQTIGPQLYEMANAVQPPPQSFEVFDDFSA